MYRHWHRFGFRVSSFGFWFGEPGVSPRCVGYIRMLKEYKQELEEVDKELKGLEKVS